MKYSLIFVLLLTLIACKKTKESASPVNTVTAGDSTSLQVSEPNASKVDVDADGTVDFELYGLSVKSGPGPSYSAEFSLRCLHANAWLRADTVEVPIWLKRLDTLYKVNSVNFHRTTFKSDCSAAPSASVQTPYRYAQLLRMGVSQEFKTTGNFLNGDFKLNRVGFNTTSPPEVNADTSFITVSSNAYCHQILQDGNNYFCFKILSNNKERYGWLLLQGQSSATISKLAIQK